MIARPVFATSRQPADLTDTSVSGSRPHHPVVIFGAASSCLSDDLRVDTPTISTPMCSNGHETSRGLGWRIVFAALSIALTSALPHVVASRALLPTTLRRWQWKP